MAYTFVPLSDAAKDLGVAASTLRHQIRSRRLTATKIGRIWFVTPEEVERYRTVSRRTAA
jgi:excisionase family DNA binding protein